MAWSGPQGPTDVCPNCIVILVLNGERYRKAYRRPFQDSWRPLSGMPVHFQTAIRNAFQGGCQVGPRIRGRTSVGRRFVSEVHFLRRPGAPGLQNGSQRPVPAGPPLRVPLPTVRSRGSRKRSSSLRIWYRANLRLDSLSGSTWGPFPNPVDFALPGVMARVLRWPSLSLL